MTVKWRVVSGIGTVLTILLSSGNPLRTANELPFRRWRLLIGSAARETLNSLYEVQYGMDAYDPFPHLFAPDGFNGFIFSINRAKERSGWVAGIGKLHDFVPDNEADMAANLKAAEAAKMVRVVELLVGGLTNAFAAKEHPDWRQVDAHGKPLDYMGPLLCWHSPYWQRLLAIYRDFFTRHAEFGSPAHDLHHTSPGTVAVLLFGTKPFSPRTLTVITLYYWFNRAQRSHPMPTAMEGLMLNVGGETRSRKADGVVNMAGDFLRHPPRLLLAFRTLLSFGSGYGKSLRDASEILYRRDGVWMGSLPYLFVALAFNTPPAQQRRFWFHCRRLFVFMAFAPFADALHRLPPSSAWLRRIRILVNGNALVPFLSGLVGKGDGFALWKPK